MSGLSHLGCLFVFQQLSADTFVKMAIWVEVRRRLLTGELSKRAACREYEIRWQPSKKSSVILSRRGIRKRNHDHRSWMRLRRSLRRSSRAIGRFTASSVTRRGGSSSDCVTNTDTSAVRPSSKTPCEHGSSTIAKCFCHCHIRRAKLKSTSALPMSDAPLSHPRSLRPELPTS